MKHDRKVLMRELAALMSALIKQGRIKQIGKVVEMSTTEMLCFWVIIYELGIEMGEMKQEIRNLITATESQKKTEEYQKYALEVASRYEAKLRGIGGLKGGGSLH